ncbi:DNA polymerase alpha/epsilon subunit B domain-containing protein [Ditylenchus destructor]|nr:DNA polymerase alpha/epsilon subunit B domain-containing protein [Ditylenchus destructor]
MTIVYLVQDDIVEKLCRSSIYVPEKVEDIPKYFCDTVWSQAHFSPLPLHFNAVIPQYDYLFHLWPTPDVLVIADKYKTFAKQDSDHSRITINPGSFPLSKFEFQVYYPGTKVVEESTLEVD